MDDTDGMQEREPIRIFLDPQSGFVHQPSNGKVRHQQAIEFLLDQFGCLAPQHDLRAPQMGFQFIQRGLSGKGLAR